MTSKIARPVKADDACEVNIVTLIERFKKMRALNCDNPYDVGLDGYVWKKFISTTRPHLIARLF